MGKPRKLRFSMKALHGVINSLTPATAAPPFCIQPAKTHSSGDLTASLSSVYCTPLSSTASEPCSQHSSQHVDTPSTSTCSSYLSYVATATDNEAFNEGTLRSTRFFFSPCNSKSITGVEEIEEMDEEIDTDVEESTTGTSGLLWESIAMAIASRDPYGDFRSSMEEMVVAHGLWDWSGLKELLQCYLRVNEKKTHKIIILAFVDLLMDLAAHGDVLNSESPFSSLCPHRLHVWRGDQQ